MSILQESYEFLQTKLLPTIAKRHQHLFTFGFEALTLRPFVSLNGNARMTHPGRKTAESLIYRLTKNSAMLGYFTNGMLSLKLVNPTDTINVDFSTFCGFQVLTFAKQTQLGRAVPVYFDTITYPIASVGSQTIFIQDAIKEFVALLGFRPHLVFDRGFESPYLVPFLLAENIPFTMRFRKDKHIRYCKKEIPLYNLPWFANDTVCEIYAETSLRVIRSGQKERMEEPWYLVTNDEASSSDQVIARYYFRFEIEETFKDLKYIKALKKFYRITKEQTFQILLWFCMLAIWLTLFLEKPKGYLIQRITRKRRKKLSLMRFFAESIQLELFTSYKQQFF